MSVVVSGGFDPLHPGHLNLFQWAQENYGRLIVVVNSDEWVSKKHSVLQTQEDRIRVIQSLTLVSVVFRNDKDDGDISYNLECVRPNAFVIGPDHTNTEEIPEYKTCKKLGIKIDCAYHLTKDYGSSIILKDRLWANPPVAVSGIISDTEGRVLLGVMRDGGKLCLPGGFLEVGETLEDGLRREIREELNTEITNPCYFSSRIGVYTDGRKITCVDFTVGCKTRPSVSSELSELQYLDISECCLAWSKSKFFTDSDFSTVKEFFRLDQQ